MMLSMICKSLSRSIEGHTVSPCAVKLSSRRGIAFLNPSIEKLGKRTSSVINRCLMIRSCATSASVNVGSSTSGSSSSVCMPVKSSKWDICRSSSASLNSVRRFAFRFLLLIITNLRDLNTLAGFRIFRLLPMPKEQRKIDNRNPFIPSLSPVCRLADAALLFSVVLFGLVAAGAVVLRQIGG
ncbi:MULTISPECIES: hypothetical protein [Rhizobium]|uniref:hypothetical protein n=1 Tax=Rhizobium TaxID=379 RepID=UPI0019346EF6|nr:hypothetical protein [Rhizobium rosettiformans]